MSESDPVVEMLFILEKALCRLGTIKAYETNELKHEELRKLSDEILFVYHKLDNINKN